MTTILTETGWEDRAKNPLGTWTNQTDCVDQGDEISEEELKLRSLLTLLKEELEILKEELERVMREINVAIFDADKHFQLQAISKEEFKLQEEELKLQAEELKLQTLLKILRKGTGAESTVNDRALLRLITKPKDRSE